jgi:hypothetical protein
MIAHMRSYLHRFVRRVACFVVLSSELLLSQSGTSSQGAHESSAQGETFGSFNLPDGSKFVTTLYDLKVIGKLKTEKKKPYYILSGVGCYGCDANTSIYIHSPSDGPMKNEGEQPRFSYPGQETDYQTSQVVSKTRMFFGDCLFTHPNAVVWFYRTLGDDKRWHDGVSVAEVRDDRLVTTEINGALPTPKDTEVAVHAGTCHELPGIAAYTEP